MNKFEWERREKEFDIEIEEQELEGMPIKEKYEYIDRAIYQYITDNLEIG